MKVDSQVLGKAFPAKFDESLTKSYVEKISKQSKSKTENSKIQYHIGRVQYNS
jgi:hypothetical protein